MTIRDEVEPYDEAQVQVTVEDEELDTDYQEYLRFEHMNLDQSILRGIYSLGFEHPSAIQKCGIVPIASGRDTLAQAQSGTGKTATFVIGSLQRVNVELVATQVLILAPTRELAMQIHSVVHVIGSSKGVTSHASVGGTKISADIASLKARPHVVVGTPGRILDMIQTRRALNPDMITVLILDEADEMLSRGFKAQIYDVFQLLKHETLQVVLVSATVPPDVLDVSKKFMRKPLNILVKNEELTLEGIRQFSIGMERDCDKFETLCDLYGVLNVSQTVIFCNSIHRVVNLADSLRSKDHQVSFIHGEMNQVDRCKTVENFRAGKSRILITTDLLARGIDVQQVSLVINYDIPQAPESYLHRIGRGGRFGRKGVAINLVNPDEAPMIQKIVDHYHTEVLPAPEDLQAIVGA